MLLSCGGSKPRSRLVAAGLVECALLCLESQVELPAAQVPADVHAGGDPPGRARRGWRSKEAKVFSQLNCLTTRQQQQLVLAAQPLARLAEPPPQSCIGRPVAAVPSIAGQPVSRSIKAFCGPQALLEKPDMSKMPCPHHEI